MPSLRTYARSFAGGEVTPEFFGRVDDVKYQTGLAVCRNFIPKPHGPVSNRGGLRFVRKVKTPAKKTRVIPFVFASDQSVVIELGAGYFRFHSGGATVLSGGVPYEISNPYAEADLAGVRFVQSNDVVTAVHPRHPPAELRRNGAANWAYAPISFVSKLAAPGGGSATATPATTSPGPKTLQSYVVTAVSGNDESAASSQGEPGDPTPPQPIGGFAISSISKSSPGIVEVRGPRQTALAIGSSVYISGVGGMSQINNRFFTVAGFTLIEDPEPPPPGGQPIRLGFTVTLNDNGVAVNTSGYSSYTSGGTLAPHASGGVSATGVGSCSNNLFDTGAYNTIAWQKVTGAHRYNIYKLANGLFGYIGQTQNLSFTDDNIAADISKTPPLQDNPFGGAGSYPSAVGYFEQRRCFAGSINEPAYFWATRSGTESSLSYSIPSRDDDSIRFRIAARERTAIRHIVPMANLVLLSESSEWRVAPASGEVLTPDVSVRAQSFIGAGEAQPVVVNNNLIFAAARGGHARELAYNWQANGYITGDLSLRAPHLFDGRHIVDMAYAKAPVPIVWCVSSSGALLGLTYVPEQEIGPWHRHDTQGGAFESICVVPESEADVLYAVVNRGGVRMIERMEPRQSDDDASGFFVDSGLSYSGAPQTGFVGLDHLEGQTVTILADGGVMPPQIVTNGGVTLVEPASTVHVGLPIEADIKSLPLAFEVQGYGQGRPKNVNEVWLRLFASRGVHVGPSFDRLTELKPRSTEPYGSPPALATGEVKVSVSAGWNPDGAVCLRHSDPLPITVVSMTLGFAVGG